MCDAMVRKELVVAGAGNGSVELPTTTAEGFSEMTVPDIVTAGPLGETLVPATEKPVGFAVMVCPAMVRTGFEGAVEEMGMVLVPSTTKDGPREYAVPEMVIGAPPCVMAIPPNEYTAGALTAAFTGGNEIVLVPITIAEDPRATGVLSIVIRAEP